MARNELRDKTLVSQDYCPECGGDLDTGWECNRCGFDAKHLIAAPIPETLRQAREQINRWMARAENGGWDACWNYEWAVAAMKRCEDLEATLAKLRIGYNESLAAVKRDHATLCESIGGSGHGWTSVPAGYIAKLTRERDTVRAEIKRLKALCLEADILLMDSEHHIAFNFDEGCPICRMAAKLRAAGGE
jgi:hypothetical protein